MTLTDLTNLTDAELIAAYREGNNAGEGFAIGRENDAINDLDTIGTFLCMIDPSLAAWERDGRLILVGDAHGPWAIAID